MKKTIALILAVAMIAALAACGKKAEEQTTAAAETAAETTAEVIGMANPMVEIGDTEEFQKELGIYIDANMLYSESTMFIIDGRIAECQFSFEDMEGKSVDCTLRATKDEESSKMLHGVYDTLKEEGTETVATADGSIDIACSATEDGTTRVYTWSIDDAWYSLVVKGQLEETELADVKESVLYAIGVEPVYEEEAAEELPEYEVTDNGTVLTVRFPANPTTGYEWSFKIWDENSLKAISSEYEQTPGTEGMAGAGGTWTAKFQSVSGRANYEYPTSNYIEFTYSRKWNGESMPNRVVDVNIVGPTIEITGIHNPDFETETAPDGTYDVSLSFTDMIRADDLTCYGLVGIPQAIVVPDEKVQSLKVGDSFNLSEYGGEDYEVPVECLEKKSDTRIVISDFESLNYDKDLGGWVVMGPDDDVYRITAATYKVTFTNETKIDDKMEEVIKSGNSGSIYDKMRSYWFVDATITVKDGWVSDITIHYHP